MELAAANDKEAAKYFGSIFIIKVMCSGWKMEIKIVQFLYEAVVLNVHIKYGEIMEKYMLKQQVTKR